MKKFIIIVVLLLLSVGFYSTPYYTAKQLQQAAQAKDSQRLNSYIDYNQVRSSLKQSLSENFSQTLLNNKTDSGMNAFATMFANAFVTPLIDALITPENMALMLQAELPAKLKQGEQTTEPNKHNDKTNELIIHQSYVDFDHFAVDIAHQQQPNAVFRFTFTRQGLFAWKLTGLTLPKP